MSFFQWRRQSRSQPPPPPLRLPDLRCAKSSCPCVAAAGEAGPGSSWHKALFMLGEYLTDAQIRDIRAHGYFYMTSQRGNLYQIRTGNHSHNVQRVIRGVGAAAYCTLPSSYGIPWPEVILCQAIALRANESAFLRAANKRGFF